MRNILTLEMTNEEAKELIGQADARGLHAHDLAALLIADGLERNRSPMSWPCNPTPEDRIAGAVGEIITEIVKAVREECECREDRVMACPACRARIKSEQGNEIPYQED